MRTELMNQKQEIYVMKMYVLCNWSVFLRSYAVSLGEWFPALGRNVGGHPES